MSSDNFQARKIGFQIASLNLESNHELLFMCTSLFKKELTKSESQEVSMVLSCLANIITKEIAENIQQEIKNLLNSSKVITKKKTFAVLGKMFQLYPQCIPDFMNILAKKTQRRKIDRAAQYHRFSHPDGPRKIA